MSIHMVIALPDRGRVHFLHEMEAEDLQGGDLERVCGMGRRGKVIRREGFNQVVIGVHPGYH
jgi:hypothetical protein